MSGVSLTLDQARYVNKAFWRNPPRAFFTFAFPLMFLVIFTALLGNGAVHIGTRTVKESTYYVASMAAFGVITACYMNIAMMTVFNRDAGVLKRIDGAPLPHGVFFISRILHSMLVAFLLVAITTAFGRFAYGAQLASGVALLRVLAMLLVGSASFCALGFAISAAIPNPDATPAVVNFSIMPLLFLSGIFIPFGNNTPGWVLWVSRIFPVRHFAMGLQTAYLGTPFHWSDVAVVAGWGLFGLVLAIRHFEWEPRH